MNTSLKTRSVSAALPAALRLARPRPWPRWYFARRSTIDLKVVLLDVGDQQRLDLRHGRAALLDAVGDDVGEGRGQRVVRGAGDHRGARDGRVGQHVPVGDQPLLGERAVQHVARGLRRVAGARPARRRRRRAVRPSTMPKPMARRVPMRTLERSFMVLSRNRRGREQSVGKLGQAAIFSIRPISSLDISLSMSTRISIRSSSVPRPIR